jgi:hypothetical protein
MRFSRTRLTDVPTSFTGRTREFLLAERDEDAQPV